LTRYFLKVSADSRVRIRLRAPDAIKVQVQGGDGLCPKRMDLVKDSAGNWNGIIPPAAPGPVRINRGSETLEKVYVKDIIPAIESFYRVKPGRENRAIAGLSMGGQQTMRIGLNHLELFGSFGFFSAAIFGNMLADPKTAFNGAFANPMDFNSKVKVFWFGAGSEETQFVKTAMDSRKKLSEAGINSAFYESKGTFHEWHTWRRCLNEFAPLLFK